VLLATPLYARASVVCECTAEYVNGMFVHYHWKQQYDSMLQDVFRYRAI